MIFCNTVDNFVEGTEIWKLSLWNTLSDTLLGAKVANNIFEKQINESLLKQRVDYFLNQSSDLQKKV